MATVHLHHLWVHRAADLGDRIRLEVDAVTPTPSRDGQIHTLGQGDQVAIVGPATTVAARYRCEQVDRADVEWLTARIGEPLLFRDPTGGLHHGILLELPTAWLDDEAADLDLTVHTVTREPT